jgi:hypothetical protein
MFVGRRMEKMKTEGLLGMNALVIDNDAKMPTITRACLTLIREPPTPQPTEFRHSIDITSALCPSTSLPRTRKIAMVA